MKLGRNWQVLAAAVLFLVALPQCSKKKGKSDLATIKVLPEKPIVILGDSSDANGKAIKGPWFSFRVNLSNGTEQPITIIALVIEVFSESDGGGPSDVESAQSPSDFKFTLASGLGLGIECNYQSFGTILPTKTLTFELKNGNSQCDSTPVFYVGNGTKGLSKNNYRYRVVIKPMGWYGDYDKPLDRFDKSFTFYTQ